MFSTDCTTVSSRFGIHRISDRLSGLRFAPALVATCALLLPSPAAAQSAARFICVYNDDRTANNSAAFQARLCVDSGATCGTWQRDTVAKTKRTIFWVEGNFSNAYYEVEAQSGGLGCNNGPCGARTQIRAGHLQSYEMSDLTPNGNWERFCRRAEATFCGTTLSATGTC